ncbi:hypothetical protein HMPREF9997_02096 [Corynebacterium durum F0235]|uniref:Uncharacterized protein n=1 Tax=Corynebacterium durum F0235 TaxID=1035195 RepID=L1MCX2_9CORY|nr:hypothetical protein HMPREF9997_02096 [Corynebacterium durum F0235]
MFPDVSLGVGNGEALRDDAASTTVKGHVKRGIPAVAGGFRKALYV